MNKQLAFQNVLLIYMFFCSLAIADDALINAAVTSNISAASFNELIQKAEHNDGDAQAKLADMFAKGNSVPQDFKQAAHWRQRSAIQGNAEAQNALGKQYAAGLGVSQDNDKALLWLQRAVKTENPEFWFDLAVFYEQLGSDEALEAAVSWHRRAVNAGHVGAHANLGLLYYNGSGVEQDLKHAANLLGFAADHDHARAQNNLGLMFTQGKGIEQDYEKAITLFQNAADQGLKEAYTNLGVMYENGFGVDFDEIKAVNLYRQAGRQDLLDGGLEQIGFLEDPRIIINAITPVNLQQLIRQAELGDAISQFQSGYLLLGSHNIAADYAAAANLFAKAADNGINTAMTNLGLLYFRGLGVPQDYVLGFMWVSLGASSGRDKLVAIRDYIMGFLTANQINDAQTMLRNQEGER